MSHFPSRQYDSEAPQSSFETPTRRGARSDRPVMPTTPVRDLISTDKCSSMTAVDPPSPQAHHDLAQLALTRAMAPSLSQEGRQMTLSECSMELDRLRGRYAALEGERDRYRDEVRRLQDEMHAVKQRGRDLEVELEGARGDLRRARATIQVQSQAIQGRRDTAPRPARNDRPLPQQQPSQAVSRFVEDYGFGPRPIANTRADPRESLYAPSQLLNTGYRPENRASSSRQPHSNDARNHPLMQHQALVPAQIGDPKWDVPWPTEFSSFFTKVEKFCSDYLNNPNEEQDKQWPLLLADNIARESHPDHVSELVSDRRTRYLLLTRIILSWVEAHYFHIKIIKGFSKESDTRVHDLHRQMKTNPSTNIRRGLAQAEADTINELTKQQSFEAWKINRIREDVNKMMTRLTDTIAPGVHLALLGTTFESILADAWRIGLMMATRTLVFHMWFPPSNFATLFNPRCMLNRNPYNQQGTPDELEKRGARVSLGITPHITIQDIMTDRAESTTVYMANVILRN